MCQNARFREQRDQALRLREQFQDIDDSALESILHSTLGSLGTIGSLMHGCGCKPCRHALRSEPCPNGLRCQFCHLDHPLCSNATKLSDVEQLSKPNKRKGKLQRLRYEKFANALSDKIQADPFTWPIEDDKLPLYIKSNPVLKAKFMVRMAAVAEKARQHAA